MIGQLQNEPHARLFSDFLYVQGIKNHLEAENDGTWALWVEGEDDLDRARDHLKSFILKPEDPEFRRVAKKAREMMDREQELDESAAKKHFDSAEIFRQPAANALGRLTLALIAVSVVVYLVREFGGNKDRLNFMFISQYLIDDVADRLRHGLPEVRQGQIWRVLTPIFLHFHFLHILFNMLWLKDLGSMVESRQSPLYLTSLVLAIGAVSNVAQYYVTGPVFGGMSGVVYGLLGYIWMKSRFDPLSGYFVHPSTVAFMLIWFVICFTNIIPGLNVANTVHGVGLAMGVGWGYLSATNPLSGRR